MHREVQRILMELLNQMDGFDQTVNVKVIMATNRADTLDPALLRPGRLDRKIEFPMPDRRQKRLVFQVLVHQQLCVTQLCQGHGWSRLHAASSTTRQSALSWCAVLHWDSVSGLQAFSWQSLSPSGHPAFPAGMQSSA